MNWAIVAAFVSALLLPGCLRDPGVIVVGSKAFSEGALLGYMELLLLQDAGLRVEDRIEMGPTLIVREALEAGEIDSCFEYTGTALVNFYHVKDPALLANPRASIADIRRLDAPKLTWLTPWALNNTYTVLMSRAKASQLGLSSISDLARYPGSWTFGSDPEFAARADGLPGLLSRYHLHPQVKQLDAGLLYDALRDGQLDAAIGYSTDGRISAFGLERLQDDRHYFPAYHPAPVFRSDTLAHFPQIPALLDPVAPKMTDDEITKLNYAMDVRHARSQDLARHWLVAHGFLKKSDP